MRPEHGALRQCEFRSNTTTEFVTLYEERLGGGGSV